MHANCLDTPTTGSTPRTYIYRTYTTVVYIYTSNILVSDAASRPEPEYFDKHEERDCE